MRLKSNLHSNLMMDTQKLFFRLVYNVRTCDGGTHETGAKVALTRIFNEYARKTGLLKEKDKNLDGSDIREGLSAIISVRIPENYLQFEGQTKRKLGTSEARSSVDAVVSETTYIISFRRESRY